MRDGRERGQMGDENMKHFGSEEWVDFVNHQMPQQQTELMRRHLETGCDRCSKLFETWNLVAQAAKREADFEVPESVVRHVVNAFGIVSEPRGIGRLFEI